MRLNFFTRCIGLLATLLLGGVSGVAQAPSSRALTEVFHDDHFQITGVTVSKTGRIFVNYPRWSDQYLNAVVEVMPDGSAKPFPDEAWNRWDLKPTTAAKQFICVQSVVVDDNDFLWILDPGAPMLITVVPGGAKLVKVDLKTNQVAQVIPVQPPAILPNSYLNDVRFDTRNGVAYMTDSGPGGIVVLNLTTGKAHRVLDGHPSVQKEEGVDIIIDGKPVVGANGKPPSFNSDGIALSPDGEYLYYQAITSKSLYRIKTSALRQENLGPEAAAAAVEKVATTFPVDGLWMDKKGNLYLSGITQKAVIRMKSDKSFETIAADPRLQWPDTFAEGPDGAIYVTASHINDSPPYNKGISVRKLPYTLFKLTP